MRFYSLSSGIMAAVPPAEAPALMRQHNGHLIDRPLTEADAIPGENGGVRRYVIQKSVVDAIRRTIEADSEQLRHARAAAGRAVIKE